MRVVVAPRPSLAALTALLFSAVHDEVVTHVELPMALPAHWRVVTRVIGVHQAGLIYDLLRVWLLVVISPVMSLASAGHAVPSGRLSANSADSVMGGYVCVLGGHAVTAPE